MILERFPEVQKLDPFEKLQLISELYDELESDPDPFPVSEELVSELNRRLEEFHADSTKYTTWEETKKRILASKSKLKDDSR